MLIKSTFFWDLTPCSLFDNGFTSQKAEIFTVTAMRSAVLKYTIPLTLRLLMSYIYGVPSKARNANVVYI